jgi:hypothetical protein
MRKQPSKPVALEEADLINFLDTQSDFAFELKTLKILNENGFCCEHGGTYHDPVTRKPRQFDIRATKVWQDLCMQLAVECKNLSDSSPLLILCVPRSPAEAFHEVVSPFKAKAFHKDASLFPNSVEGVLPLAFTQKTESIRFSGKKASINLMILSANRPKELRKTMTAHLNLRIVTFTKDGLRR